MTAQVAEILHYKGERLRLCATPLNLYLTNNPLPAEPNVISSACWRGYIGEWLIEHKRLYLVGLEDLSGKPISLSSLFSGNPSRVFAHWVTDELRCPQGRRLKYVHGGFASIHERDLMLNIKQGEFIAERLVHNGTSDDPSAATEYGPGAWVTMPSGRRSK